MIKLLFQKINSLGYTLFKTKKASEIRNISLIQVIFL